MSLICGIDPGLRGAIAFYWTDRPNEIIVDDMPVVDSEIDAAALARMLEEERPDALVVELQGARPKQGLGSSYKTGVGFGVIRGVAAALRIPRYEVTAGRWKKYYSLSGGLDGKEKSRALAIQYFPQSDRFKRKVHHGRAEASLLALYGASTIHHLAEDAA